MQTADFDHNDFQTNEADKSLLVKFFIKPRIDREATEREGREIYKDVEHIDIKPAGDRNGSARPATDMDRRRFPEHYARFKNRIEAPMDMGTPLTEWAPCSRSRAEELAFANVKTVEQLANMADSQVASFMGLYALKEKAKTWLEHANAEKPIYEMKKRMDELEEKNEELQEALRKVLDVKSGSDVTEGTDRQKQRAKQRVIEDAKAKVS